MSDPVYKGKNKKYIGFLFVVCGINLESSQLMLYNTCSRNVFEENYAQDKHQTNNYTESLARKCPRYPFNTEHDE